MKKLLQINTVVNSGSTGKIAEEIGKSAIDCGWNSYIAYGREVRSSDSKLIKIGNDWDIKFHGLQTRLFDKHGLASNISTRDLVKQIIEIKPDLINLHNIHGYFLNYEILFKYLTNTDIPVVWTLHDCWAITGHCTHFSFVKCEKWKSLCYNCPQTKEYPASWLIDRSKKNFTLKKNMFTSLHNLTLVPVSNWLSDIIKKSYLREFPIKVIHNGIDTNVFKPSTENNFRMKYGLNNKYILLGVSNIWGQRKGLNDFIELSKLLTSEFQIVLVGINQRQKNQLPDNILSIPRTDSIKELVDLYSASDVFINPTYEDTFPTTNLESLSCGTPVITYNTGGCPEAIDESTGIIVEQGDIKSLLTAINQIKYNGKHFYTDACLRRANSLYRKEDRYIEYIELYEEILKDKK